MKTAQEEIVKVVERDTFKRFEKSDEYKKHIEAHPEHKVEGDELISAWFTPKFKSKSKSKFFLNLSMIQILFGSFMLIVKKNTRLRTLSFWRPWRR